MRTLTIPLSLVAAVTLAACGGYSEVRPVVSQPAAHFGPAQTIVTAAPRAGAGKVVYLVDPTGPIDGVSTQYMTLKMEDGSTQDIVHRGQQIAMGANVVIRSDSIQTVSRN